MQKPERICVIGNSHVACLKSSLGQLDEILSFDAVFFADRGRRLTALEIRDGKLYPSDEQLSKAINFTSEGRGEIDFKDYDRCLLVGLGLRFPYLFHSLSRKQYFTRSVYEQVLMDQIQGTPLLTVLGLVRLISDIPVSIFHNPLKAAKGINEYGTDFYHEFISSANRLVFSELNAELLPQPEETIVNGINSDMVFALDSPRLKIRSVIKNDKHDEGELLHMNNQFGLLLWNDYLFHNLNK